MVSSNNLGCIIVVICYYLGCIIVRGWAMQKAESIKYLQNYLQKLFYYHQQLLHFQYPIRESCTLSFLQSPFCTFCISNFVKTNSDAISA